MAEVVEEAAERAKNQFKIEKPLENMFVAEAFAIQSKIIKGAKRHAHSVRSNLFIVKFHFSVGVFFAIAT